MIDVEQVNWIRSMADQIYREAAALAVNELRGEEIPSSTLKTMAKNALLAASVWHGLMVELKARPDGGTHE